ncbi:hypothetical protein, partial [Hymenobacter glacialis]|uniref:hypothetical protein n=1 Tax=Hymenobacter glacialis TaxID=1908236 RepID=UPI0013018F1B
TRAGGQVGQYPAGNHIFGQDFHEGGKGDGSHLKFPAFLEVFSVLRAAGYFLNSFNYKLERLAALGPSAGFSLFGRQFSISRLALLGGVLAITLARLSLIGKGTMAFVDEQRYVTAMLGLRALGEGHVQEFLQAINSMGAGRVMVCGAPFRVWVRRCSCYCSS